MTMNGNEYKNIFTYTEAVEYINRLPKFCEGRLLSDTRRALELLGSPEKELAVIHVAGTNGKGSTCAYLLNILEAAGKKTAFFSSPHLTDMRERFRIGKEIVSETDFCKSFSTVYSVLVVQAGYRPIFFEYLFLMAMLIFKEKKPQYCILETGLGGRLDATNVIEKPVVSVITGIGFDHMEYLGGTLAEIAAEKAGIIKAGIPVVYWKEKEEVSAVIEEKARSLSSPCISVSKDGVDLKFFGDKYIDFSYKSRYYDYVGLRVNTKAVYQTENAAIAITVAEQLWQEDVTPYVMEGIASMHWEGRMEEVLPGVFFDGAHNEDGIEAFLTSVKHDNCKGSRSLLFSVVQDKEYPKMADRIMDSGLFSKIYTAPIASERSVSREALEEMFSKDGVRVYCFDTPQEALLRMFDDRGTADCLYVAGSLYLIGQLKEWLSRSSTI